MDVQSLVVNQMIDGRIELTLVVNGKNIYYHLHLPQALDLSAKLTYAFWSHYNLVPRD